MLEFILMILLLAVASMVLVRMVLRPFFKKPSAKGGCCGGCTSCTCGKLLKEDETANTDFFKIGEPETVKAFFTQKKAHS